MMYIIIDVYYIQQSSEESEAKLHKVLTPNQDPLCYNITTETYICIF